MQLPTDDFVKHFGVCQQIMQGRMSLRGDLPHSVVILFLSLDWLPLPDASWQSAGILQLQEVWQLHWIFHAVGALFL